MAGYTRRSSRISSRKGKDLVKEVSQSPYFIPSKETRDVFKMSAMSLKSKKMRPAEPDSSFTVTFEDKPLEKICRLGRSFYDRTASDLAKCLLGKRLCRILEDGEILRGRIVETEGYLGETDKACHSFGGRKTPRTEAMYMAPGTAYVYFIYGMHFCLNISSKDAGGAVLIRALEPVQGLHKMTKLRGEKRKSSVKPLKTKDLCNGPSKLCQAMSITKDNLNKEDMVSSKILWIEDEPDIENDCIVTTTRIGIDSCGQEAVKMPLRFYICGNKCVSVRDKLAEIQLNKHK